MDLNQTPQQYIPEQTPIQPNIKFWLSAQNIKFLAPVLSLFLLLFIAGIVMYFANRQTTPEKASVTPFISPTAMVGEEEQELNKIDAGDIEKDFQDIQGSIDKL